MKRKEPEDLRYGDKQRDPKVDSRIKLVDGHIVQPPDVTMHIHDHKNIVIFDQTDSAVLVLGQTKSGDWCTGIYMINIENSIDPEQPIMKCMEAPSNFSTAVKIYENTLAKLSSGKMVCTVDRMGNLSFKEKD